MEDKGIIMKRYYRASNDEKRHKPLITKYEGGTSPTWVVSTTTAGDVNLIKCVATHAEALAIANQWADEYRDAWVKANMHRASKSFTGMDRTLARAAIAVAA
jgi:hypothetical protein